MKDPNRIGRLYFTRIHEPGKPPKAFGLPFWAPNRMVADQTAVTMAGPNAYAVAGPVAEEPRPGTPPRS